MTTAASTGDCGPQPPYGLWFVRTRIFDSDADGLVFSRDCCECYLDTQAASG